MGKQLLSNSSPFNNVHNVYPMNYSPYMNINNNMCLNNNCNTLYNQFYVLNNNMVNNGSNNINSCYNSSYFQSCNGNNYTPSMYQNYNMRYCNYNNKGMMQGQNINNLNNFFCSGEFNRDPIIPKKYNSSHNIYKDLNKSSSPRSVDRGKKSKSKKSQSVNTSMTNSNKKTRKKSSLFQNETNKAENDLRDFQRFCDGLKCELPEYICGQIGSRIMQKYLNKFPSEILTLLIIKLGASLNRIMIDIYGNYFCQKLFNICTSDQRILILENIKNNFVSISKDNSGTHVIQAMLDTISSPTEEILILTSLKGHEMDLAFDTNGTHVLQKILSVIDESKREQLNNVLFNESNIKALCIDSKGICVIKKMIKEVEKDIYKSIIIDGIFSNCIEISENPYGNYAIQCLIDEWGIDTNIKIVNYCIDKADTFSIQKYSSNIIDKLINNFISNKRVDLFSRIRSSLFNLNQIKGVYNNKYGKFILIKVANLMKTEEREQFKNDLIEKEKEANVKDKKRIEIIMEILNKCDENYMNKCFSKEDI